MLPSLNLKEALMTLWIRTTLLAALLLAPTAAAATTINLTSTLDGAQANAGAGTGSSGTGSATLTFDTVTNLLSWSGSFSGLTGNYSVSHFHGPALPSQNAGVQVAISVIQNPDLKSGTFNGSATLSAGQATDLLADLWYINIHSAFAPGGEIRGQVLVPEPGLAVLLAGAALLLARRRP